MRFTEINLFGVYVAPMSSMMGCRLGGDDRTALVAARFGLTQYVLLAQRHRRRVAAQKASTPKYSGDCLIAERLRRPRFVSRRFQCRMTTSGAKALSDTPAGTGRCPPHC